MGRCVMIPDSAGSEPVGWGADWTGAAGAISGVDAASEAVMPFLDFAGLPLAPSALAASLAAFLSFLACFLALISSGV